MYPPSFSFCECKIEINILQTMKRKTFESGHIPDREARRARLIVYAASLNPLQGPVPPGGSRSRAADNSLVLDNFQYRASRTADFSRCVNPVCNTGGTDSLALRWGRWRSSENELKLDTFLGNRGARAARGGEFVSGKRIPAHIEAETKCPRPFSSAEGKLRLRCGDRKRWGLSLRGSLRS